MEDTPRFTTPAEACPYLPDREWKLEIWFRFDPTPAEHEDELSSGARRFGRTYFRPACDTCRECIPLRVPVASFAPSKSQRRVLKRNPDIRLEIGEPVLDEERLDLYRRFHRQRHETLGWRPHEGDPHEYIDSFIDNAVPTHEFRYFLENRLVALAYVDESAEALSSQYAFHDPDLGSRSLGTFDVLKELETARAWGKKYLYLGYYVRGCRSMEYKARFRPFELRSDADWKLSPPP